MNSSANSNFVWSDKDLKKYFIFLLVVGSLVSRAAAYTLIVTSAGRSPAWASMPVPFWISQAGSPQIANGSEFVAVQSAFQTWQNVSIANVAFQYQGTTPVSTVGQDGLNVVTFVDGSVPMGLETIGATFLFLTVDPTGNLTIQEADIALSPAIGFSTSGDPDKYDIQSVVTHEVGHLLGLDHSGLLSSVMTPLSNVGQLDQRTLSYDDMAGAAFIYPQNSSTLSSLSGNVTLAGNGVSGAHVVAVDANGSVIASTISNPDGSYEIDSLPPGTYRLYAEPLDGPVTEQNIGGTPTSFFTGLQTNFGTTYSGDVSNLGQASTIQLFPGRPAFNENIHLLPASSLNLVAPFNYATHIAAGDQSTLNVGGSGIVSGDTFSASDPGITIGNPIYGGSIGSAEPTSAQLPITVAATLVPGPKNIAVTSNGSTSVLSGGVVIVNPQPSNILVAPASGSVDGGTGVSITGQNFRDGAQVYFGGLAATNVQVVNSTTIQAVTPANSAGSENVVVVNSDGTWGVQTNAFTYTEVPPTITSVSPLSGQPSTIVIISGSEFSSRISDMDVRFNGVPASVASTSRTSVTVLVPFAATTGPVTVTVGGNTATGPSFTVTAPTASTNLANTTTPFIDATAGGTALSFGNNDDASALITLPFTFTLFDKTYMAGSQVGVSTNGWISLDGFTQPQFQSGGLPSSTLPPALIAPFFTDLFLPGGSSVYVQTAGSAPNRQLVIEWLNAGILDQQGNDLGSTVTFEAVLYEGTNDIQFIYGSMNGTASDGSTATIGIQNSSQTQAVQTGYKQSVVSSGTVLGYHFINGAYVPLSAPPSDTPYSIPNLGGFSMITDGSGAITIGFATAQPAAGSTAPSGVAIFGYTVGTVLVSEAGVPAAPPLLSGRMYAEVGSLVNTGVAIANPNAVSASISFHFTDSTGADSGSGTLSLPPNGHLAQFLSESAFKAPGTFQGTFTFSSNVPVGVIALRSFINETGATLLSTLPVTDLSAPVANTTALIPHFAAGSGWTTQVILVNPTSAAMTGSIQFATPDGQTISTSAYSIPQNSSFKLVNSGAASTVQTGSIQVIPDTDNMTPTSVAIFTYRPGAITVSEAAVLPTTSTALRMYVEESGVAGAAGSIRSGVAFANTTSTAVTVNISLTDLAGNPLGTTSMNLPANGQLARFVDELFPGVSTPFKGVLRLSTSGSAIAVAELRGHYNQLGNFLMSTTPPTDENAAAPTTALVFPQIANGGGFTTQFILFSGAAGQSASGDLRLIYEN